MVVAQRRLATLAEHRRKRLHQRRPGQAATDLFQSAGGYAVIGIVSMLLGSAYLHNFCPFGTAGTLASSGSISMLNVATALEVTAAFVLLFTEFLEELVVVQELPE